MLKRSFITILIYTAFCLIGTSFVCGQEGKIYLKDKAIKIKMDNQPLGLVFRYLGENYDISIGFEQSVLDRNHSEYAFETNLPVVGKKKMDISDGNVISSVEVERYFQADNHPITVNIENGRLDDVLNVVVKQMENYQWEINDEVVNIFPVRGRDPRFEKLLDINIKSFYLSKGKTVNDITTKIRSLGVLYNFYQANNLIFNGGRTGSHILINAQYGRTIDQEMNFSNLKLRDLLNKITKIKKGGWILNWRGRSKTTNEDYIDIDI